MERFYRESGIRVFEWEAFERSILHGQHGFALTPEQWRNRRSGRTYLKESERIAMLKVLKEIRKQQSKK